MTKKIGISLPDELYEWAVREVEEGRADSVSGIIAAGLEVLQGYAELAALIKDLEADAQPLSEEDERRIEEMRQAGARGWRQQMERRKGQVA